MSAARDLEQYAPIVRALASTYGLPNDPAESLSRAWDGFRKALATYDPDHPSGLSFESWAAWTAKGRLHALRKSTALRASRERVAYERDAGTWEVSAPDNDVGPEDRIQSDVVRGALRVAVERLPARQRAAVDLVYFRDLNQREAADELGVSYQAVQHLLRDAMRALRSALRRVA